ncbi:hypothetical protein QE441_002513 [Chryseobacterium sp. SORGH_AS909]|uniref:Uncharacterized protein n=1 Tax=Chryseobacterium camelliae TaxID=1265445 RepID=A0ABU0TH04_9FLAO|nr:hypothetical protein [Chryseobacterium camelliae]MDQ1099373.1 hypothetical protein [Chryseobacterium sp. SORGH_AS_1048]MDR6086719.1 hypothetical protein [Chryseobacterium sp. SORGH_AS_0909]MDR6131091.1 hypothetical protein [Chryseobacterium sp. SORGH_AS_1175]MDT3406771.1 hypothetical protein [Pseudacidovorax intermedius]
MRIKINDISDSEKVFRERIICGKNKIPEYPGSIFSDHSMR